MKGDKMKKYTEEKFPDLPEEYYKQIEKKYGAAHVEAIKAGQKAVSPEDLALQGRLRDDDYRPEYIEDYATLDPKIDIRPDTGAGKAQKPHWPTLGEFGDDFGLKMIRLTQKSTDDQLSRAMVRALRKVKESKGAELLDLTIEELDDLEKDPELLQKYLAVEGDLQADPNAQGPEYMTRAQAEQLDEAIEKEMQAQLDNIERHDDVASISPTGMELIADGPAGTIRAHSAESLEFGKIPGVAGLYKLPNPDEEGADDDGAYQEIQRLTGMSLYELQSLFNKVLVTRFVHNQTRLGKVRSLSVLAICGNGNGRLGMAMAKSTEPEVATQTAKLLAIRNMKPVRRYENRTVYGNVKAKVSGTVVELFARPPGMFTSSLISTDINDSLANTTFFTGFGLRVPHRIFEMSRAAGLHDLASSMPRSKNPMNSVKAAYQALLNQPDPEEIAIGRGKKLVDARKVYYGGSVY